MAAGQYKRSIVWKPQPKQAAFMRRCEDEALYGGAAGGGKSDALVIEALRQVNVPHYRGLIVRKTYPQLSELIDKTMQYYRPVFPKARYNASSHVWTFPSGAKIYFGSMFRTQDKYNYQGKAFDFIGVDELTHFTWEEYSYLMSRNRPTGPGTVVYMQARRIREAEQNDPMLKGRVIQGVADPAIFNESQGESIAQMQEKYPYFLTWRPGDHTRIAGKMQLHYRLAFDAEGGRCFRCLTLAGILSAPSRTLCMTRATWRTLTPRRRTTSTTSAGMC